MKLLFLAAAAAIAVPAAAQTTTSDTMTQDQTTADQSTQDTMSTPAQTTPEAMPAQPPMSAPSADAADPAGGYAPSAPPMMGTPEPGANVIFQPSQSPDQAFPPPPPMQDYPVCKAGQTDNCRQRGG